MRHARQRSLPRRVAEPGWVERLRHEPGSRGSARALLVIGAVSVILRMALTTVAHAPVVFSDELGYAKLAAAIGQTGRFALFNRAGLSVSPLYSAILSPVYAVGAAAPTAYAITKVVNSLLISLSIFPVYKIARFVLTRRSSLVVAAISVLTPLMFYSSFTLTENVAYPMALGALWSLLVAIRSPTPRNDAIMLAVLVGAAVARAQLLVLFPVALTALVLVGLVQRNLVATLRKHAVVLAFVVACLGAAGAATVVGQGVYSLLGVYANIGRDGRPSFERFVTVFVRHFAEIDLAVGVVPFVAAVVAAFAFARRGLPKSTLPFAAVAVSTVVWLLIEVAYDSALYDGTIVVPRIHERFLIYVVPFFLVALLATIQIPEAVAPLPVYLFAAVFAALLPLAIPFHSMVNQPSAVDTFGLQALAHTKHGRVVALPYAAPIAVTGAALLGLLFVNVRRQLRPTIILVLIPLTLISGQVLSRVNAGSVFTRSRLPARADWVDAAKPRGEVALLTGSGDAVSALETAYFNLSIARLYYLCHAVAGPEFGEEQATVAGSERLRGSSGPIRADYVVAPTGLGVRGRVVAENRPGRQVLVSLPARTLAVSNPPRCTD